VVLLTLLYSLVSHTRCLPLTPSSSNARLSQLPYPSLQQWSERTDSKRRKAYISSISLSVEQLIKHSPIKAELYGTKSVFHKSFKHDPCGAFPTTRKTTRKSIRNGFFYIYIFLDMKFPNCSYGREKVTELIKQVLLLAPSRNTLKLRI